MRDRLKAPISRRAIVLPAAILGALLPAATALADGSIKFIVIDAKTKKPLPRATIQLDPDETELEGIQFDANDEGIVETGDLIAGTRGFRARALVNGISYKLLQGRVTIIDGQEIEIVIQLDELGYIEKILETSVQRIDLENTSNSTFRDRKFFELFPVGVGNLQSFSKQLKAFPGMVPDSINRVHPRGEQEAMTVSLDGFLLPGFAVGRASQLLDPGAIETYRLRTAGFGAQYGGVSGAVADLTLRPGITRSTRPIVPYVEYRLNDTGFNGAENAITLGRQIGATRRPARDGRLGYFVTLSQRFTQNAVEAPQPNVQGRNNAGISGGAMGKVEWQLSRKVQIATLFGANSGRTGIANRVGLGTSYANQGQGFGFGGERNANDFPVTLPGGQLSAATQQFLGNDTFQKDNNRFYVLQYRAQVSPSLSGVVGVGYVKSTQSILNRTPGVPLSQLPADSSVEYKPTVVDDYEQAQLQADFTLKRGDRHTLQFGVLSQDMHGRESYQFIPQSQRALEELRAFNPRVGPLLVPVASPEGPASPILRVRREGTYSAAYIQDTFSVRRSGDVFRINFGVRSESWEQSHAMTLGLGTNKLRSSATHPRVNIVYQLPRRGGLHLLRRRLLRINSTQPTALRASYNRLFTQPGLSQGALNLFPAAPQFTDQFDLSVERQLHRQIVKVGLYAKEIENQIGYQQLIPGPQNVAYTTVNLGRASARGFEIAYEFNPRDFAATPGELREYEGLAGFLVYSNGSSRRYGSRTPQGFPVVTNDQDQRATLTAGVGYRTKRGTSMGLSYYYGSGLFSSALNGKRQPISEVNLKVATPPNFFHKSFGLEFAVENLFDGRSRMNFVSPFAGTRFQQGRRFLASVVGKF